MSNRRTQSGTLTVALRPLRLAFIVKPGDKAGILRAIQINTILWGGMLNPILPAFRRSPRSYADGRFKPPAVQIVSGYLAAYDPDFVVTLGTALPRGVAFDKERVIGEDAILAGLEEEEAVWHGVGLNEIIAHLYATEYRFVRRHPEDVFLSDTVQTQDRLMVAACFGELLAGTRVDFHRLWAERLDGRTKPFDPTDVLRATDPTAVYPLRVGMHNIDVLPRQQRWHDRSIFWMDATDPEDVLDYWNLRAAGHWVLPLPMQWADELRDGVRHQVERNYRPDRLNKQIMYGTRFIKSRHTRESDLSGFVASLALPAKVRAGEQMVSLQRGVPRVYSEWGRGADEWDPCRVVAEQREIRIADIEEDTEFQTILPAHAERDVWGTSARYANVVSLRAYGAEDTVAPVIPPNLKLGRSLRPLAAASGDFRVGRDGLTMSNLNVERSFVVPVPSSWGIFSAWLSASGCAAEISSGGRVVQAMLECLGGIHMIRAIQGWRIIFFLNSLVTQRSADGAEATPKERIKHITSNEAANCLSPPRDEAASSSESGSDLFRMLVELGVLEVGADLQCAHCGRGSWFSLEQIHQELTCSICTRHFPFPATKPPSKPWRYRPVGPFSLPGYANGCYTVLLAIYFLTRTLNASATVVPSFELTPRDGKVKEADFGMLWRDSMMSDGPDFYPIFGECKSLNAFVNPSGDDNSVEKMGAIAELFPGAVLVFATLAEDLHVGDRKALQDLANAGREPWKGNRRLNPVLVLTRNELMSSSFAPPRSWQDATGPIGDFVRRHRFVRGINDLCDLTQQLYLGMPPWHEWFDQRLKARAERRRARRGKRTS